MDCHTPGPWTVEELEGYITGHVTSPLHTYCGNSAERRDSITAPASMTRADALLIAAAPDLLAALRSLESVATETHASAMRPQWNVIERLGRAIDAARTAIAKARATEPSSATPSPNPAGGGSRPS